MIRRLYFCILAAGSYAMLPVALCRAETTGNQYTVSIIVPILMTMAAAAMWPNVASEKE